MFVLLITAAFENLAAQSRHSVETLILNREKYFKLKSDEEKDLFLNLKQGAYTEISYSNSLEMYPKFSLLSPSGKDIFETIYVTGSIEFVAPESGKYTLTVKFINYDDAAKNKSANVSVSYSNIFSLPKIIKQTAVKQINGYVIKSYVDGNDSDGTLGSYLLIYKNGKMVSILKGDSIVGGGFNFSEARDENIEDDKISAESARLFRTTPDKTGDGTPDIAVGYYTGGAHCCFDMHFYELGANGVKKLKIISGQDSPIIAIGKQTSGSLILQTGDSNFAYWKTCFACSPIPKVILTYQNGEFRPDTKLMNKPAPSIENLRAKAEEYKKEMNSDPYISSEDGTFAPVFWEEMVELLYTGNETAAWQFFDLVWDKQKPGKEKFKQDFLEQLNKSEYWRQMQEDRNKTQK